MLFTHPRQKLEKGIVDVEVLSTEEHYGGIAYYILEVQKKLNGSVYFYTPYNKDNISFLTNIIDTIDKQYQFYLNTNLLIPNKTLRFLRISSIPIFTVIYDLMIFHKDHEQYKAFDDQTRNLMLNMYNVSIAIITISEQIKNEIIQTFNIPAYKIFVAYPGVSGEFKNKEDMNKKDYIMTNYQPEGQYFLKALGLDVYQVGNVPNQNKELMAEELGSKYHDIGFVSRERLVELYQEQKQFFSDQKYEGFDMQPLEQLQCHTKVVQSHSNVHDEILKDFDNVIFYEDHTPAEVIDFINTKSSFEHDDKLLQKYTWDNTVSVIKKVLNIK